MFRIAWWSRSNNLPIFMSLTSTCSSLPLTAPAANMSSSQPSRSTQGAGISLQSFPDLRLSQSRQGPGRTFGSSQVKHFPCFWCYRSDQILHPSMEGDFDRRSQMEVPGYTIPQPLKHHRARSGPNMGTLRHRSRNLSGWQHRTWHS